jgi:uracil permease
MSFVVKKWGITWIEVVMPPTGMGAVVAIIGLELAPIAAQQAGLAPSPAEIGKIVEPFVINGNTLIVSMSTLCIGILGSVIFRGFMQVIPILIAVVAGYIIAMIIGMVDTSQISNAGWITFPKFSAPVFDLNAIMIFKFQL